MADTQTLLALIDEFPQPFLDPEATPAPEVGVEVEELPEGFQKYVTCLDLDDGQCVDLLMEDGTVYKNAWHYIEEARSGDPCTAGDTFIHDDAPDKDGYVRNHLIKAWKLTDPPSEEIVERVELLKSPAAWRDSVTANLAIIEGEPDLEMLAYSLLAKLTEIAELRRLATQKTPSPQQPLPSVWDDALTEFEMPNLPETHARKGSGDCPSGMCPIDH